VSLLRKNYLLILIEHQSFLRIHICTHLDTDISICMEAEVFLLLDACALTCFDDRA